MVSFEWNPERAREIAWEEGHEEGRREAREKIIPRVVLNLFRKKYSISYIADTAEISAEEVKQILRSHGIAF